MLYTPQNTPMLSKIYLNNKEVTDFVFWVDTDEGAAEIAFTIILKDKNGKLFKAPLISKSDEYSTNEYVFHTYLLYGNFEVRIPKC